MEQQSRQTYWHGRAVLVTGATGFVGYHVALQLVQSGADVVALVRPTADWRRLAAVGVRCKFGSLEDASSIEHAMGGCEYVFHVAGAVSFQDDWELLERINVEGTRRVLAAATQKNGVRRLVYTSSVVTIGASPRPELLDENSPWDLGRLRVAYVTTKREAEQLAMTARGHNLEVVVVNPASVVGPDDFSRSEFGTLCRRFWRRRIPLHFGGGNNFVDVRDVATGHLLAARSGRAGERYILGGENLPMARFFAELARHAEGPIFRLQVPNFIGPAVAELNNRFMASRAARPYLSPAQARMLDLFWYYRCDKAAAELGYRARPLAQTLADTYQFWCGRRAA